MAWTRYSLDTDFRCGPHEGFEIALIKRGLKPVGLIEPHKMPPVKTLTDAGLIVEKFELRLRGPGKPHYMVALPSERRRMEMAIKEFQLPYRRHARIGILLGYSKAAIRDFIKHQGPYGGKQSQEAA